ncbi:epoxide hydrolase domain-containing protein [Marasmius fiardii PR-910]|nr:epoxide hydrolase domain-containing protein [Marasmius fiardii PR-910]
MATPKPYNLNVPSEFLDWVNNRVKTAHLVPDLEHAPGEEWRDGTPTTVMEDLVQYWKTDYDWRIVEKKINDKFPMFTLDVEEGDETIQLHFVHKRSERPDAVPLLFAHGWPGNFLEVENFLQLTSPADPKAQPYHIIAPSLPGFTLSSSPKKPGFAVPNIARVYHKLMLTLGYHHYLGQGGDWGSFVLRSMALQFPDACIGIHLNFIVCLPPSPLRNPVTLLWLILRWFTPDQKERLKRMQWWMKQESGYSRIQGTKPQSISYGLLDSPVGMLAWIREKLQSIVEPDYVWEKETCITFAMLYLISGSAAHARIYKENIPSLAEDVMGQKISSSVAVGVSCFPKDVGYVPRWWAEANSISNIVFWKEHAKGGHFPSVEVPDTLMADVQEWAEVIRSKEDPSRWESLLNAGRGRV